MADNEFDDDIDWSSVAMPKTPTTVTPSNKRPRLTADNYDASLASPSSSSLLQDLEMAPAFGGEIATGREEEDASKENEEVGDALQLKAIELANNRENLFLTGKAGTGKSWTIKKIVKCFHEKGKVIHVTAPTGIAAINVGGMTIHNWGRFRLGEYYADFNNMMSPDTRKKLNTMDALLIDEISMMDGHLFDVLECMISIIRCYERVKDKLEKIRKDIARTGNIIMSETMLKLRWDAISEYGLGDIHPFGGLQLIVVGDFYQLPPVPSGFDVLMENENLKEADYHLKIGRQGSYAFESHAWHHSSFQTVELTEVHRQAENDGLFQFLNAMREGEPDLVQNHARTLNELQSPLPKRGDGIIPTELHSKNYIINRINKEELGKLPGSLHEYVSLDEVELGDEYKMKTLTKYGLQDLAHDSIPVLLEKRSLPRHVKNEITNDMELISQYAQEHFFEKECRVSHNMELKIDAQVMLLWNLDVRAKLANGSRGIVKGFFPAKGYNYLIKEEYKKREMEMSESSARDDASCEESQELARTGGKGGTGNVVNEGNKGSDLAVITPSKGNKMQGYDFSNVDPKFVKETQSRVACMSQYAIERDLKTMSTAIRSGMTSLPFVLFCNGNRLILPQPFSKEFKGVGAAIRWQIPLTLAWAISIHKSQGMTIECLRVNLTDCFAIGQAYVACSRGKCLNSMTVENFKPSEIKTSKKVKNFYHAISSGKPYTGGFWSDTIAKFDEGLKVDMVKKMEMKKHYNNTVCCLCGTMCVVNQIKTNRNNNRGRFFISCPNANGEWGHTWELVSSSLLKTSDDATSNDGNQPFRLLTPGVDGAIEGRLDNKRFVTTGVFPELGGGIGLKLGKEKIKGMIESFGGKVTGSISGRTNFIIVGVEPGEKRLEDAKKKGIPTVDRFELHKILMGETELPVSAKDESQPKMTQHVKSEARSAYVDERYEC